MPVYGGNYYGQTAPGLGTGTPIYNGPVYQTPSNNSPGIVWVSGEEQARNFPVLPGNSLLLMDMNNLTLYSKSVLANGQMALDIYDLIKREPEKQEAAQSVDFVKRDELEGLISAAVTKAMQQQRKPIDKPKQYDKPNREVKRHE